MSKKQVRIKPSELADQSDQLRNEWLNFILKNGSVFLCQIDKFKQDKIILRNTRLGRITIPLQEIDEVWQELKTE
jgi:hypothetical protein